MKEDTPMADMPTYPDTGDDPGAGPNRGSPPGTPRWVKVFGITVIVLVLLVVIIMFTGVGGEHGPRRHMPSGDAGETPPSSVSVDHTPPKEHGVQQS